MNQFTSFREPIKGLLRQSRGAKKTSLSEIRNSKFAHPRRSRHKDLFAAPLLWCVNNKISSICNGEFHGSWRKLHDAAAFDGCSLFARCYFPKGNALSAFNGEKRIVERETRKASYVHGFVTPEPLARDKIPNIYKRRLSVPPASQSNQGTGSARDNSMRWCVIILHGAERYGGLISLRLNF